ncbi:hypothetical protein GGTG_01799 [Gaeumannomyces tritici R3-111a-1]|uniref:Uncharacterized protein n=1 Tax=Gaeumannomyces tritici (strain R3-111a-1) TaxID=644352 RepID=J3NKK8_GAET3|nr:hypothetical protein GGTG_01799 [Gaeumannomyces tritici R3-111a-1]EJT81825.1 hypothetical protein GGTG_01799 [Gaeumannomyces tritici R3-111a-1]
MARRVACSVPRRASMPDQTAAVEGTSQQDHRGTLQCEAAGPDPAGRRCFFKHKRQWEDHCITASPTIHHFREGTVARVRCLPPVSSPLTSPPSESSLSRTTPTTEPAHFTVLAAVDTAPAACLAARPLTYHSMNTAVGSTTQGPI